MTSAAHISRVLTILVASMLATGCFSTNPPKRGPLSEAMEKASDDNTGSRRVSTPPSNGGDYLRDSSAMQLLASDSSETHDTYIIAVHPVDEELRDSTRTKGDVWLGVMGGVASPGSQSFDASSGYGLLGGVSFDHHRLDGYFVVDHLPLADSSALAKSIDDDLLPMRVGLQYRYSFTPSYTMLGFYWLAGGGYSLMAWDYRNSIISGRDRIGSDMLEGIELYAGVGVNVLQTTFAQLGIEAIGGVTLWGPTTYEGFSNDIFDPLGYLKLRAVISVKISSD